VLDRLHALETFGIKLGLENITRLCAALDHPERAFVSLHIAGTNGKGSVTAIAHAALRAAGLRSARYTSPHLVTLNERFVIGDAAVGSDLLESVATDVLDLAERLVSTGGLAAPPTFFEATTAIAFELFRRARVEVAVVEVGLGGRFDATNILSPVAGAITSVGFDHTEHLGETLGAIATEKAGIIKHGMTVVTGTLPDEASAMVARVAGERGARVVSARDGAVLDVDSADGRTRLTLRTPADVYGPVALALRGEHQIENALVAVRLLESARDAGLHVPRSAIEHGLASVTWPARLEMLALTPPKRLLLDAAHNLDGATALAAYLTRWHPERPPLVLGMMVDKDVDGILRALLPATSTVVVTAVDDRRAMPVDRLAARVRALAPTRLVSIELSPAAAVRRALEERDLVCVAGSIYLVGAVRDAVEQRAILG